MHRGRRAAYPDTVSRGLHRVYLGAAPGVGKTFAMLNEGNRRRRRGDDVVVAWFEEHRRAETTAKLEDLEVVPPRSLGYRGSEFEEMDVDGVLARRPEVALVDELAHTNVPGSRNAKRWQDVEELLDAGISVISTLNIQHLESINDVVERITGVRQSETIPDAEVRRADQIELVDLTPEALRRRLARGDVYAADKIDAALANYFRAGNLGALRELALLWVADRVEEALDDYMEAHGIAEMWETRERVVVAVAGKPGDESLVRRAARIAARGRGDLLACHVRSAQGWRQRSDPAAIEDLRRLVADLGGEFHEIAGGEVAASLLDFARAEHATQLVLGASSRSRFSELIQGSIINEVNRASGEIDVHIISEPRRTLPLPGAIEGADASSLGLEAPTARRPPGELAPRRRLIAAALLVVGLPLLTAAMIPVRDEIGLGSASLLYTGLVVVLAMVGGWRWSLVGGVLAALCLNFFFTEPLHTLRVSDSAVIVSLVVFVVLSGAIGVLVGLINRRTLEADAARGEAQALAYVAGAHDEQLEQMVGAIRAGFGLGWVAIYEQEADSREWSALAAAGDAPADPDGAEERLEAGERLILALGGRPLSGDDRRVLGVLAQQLGGTIDRGRLRREVDRAARAAASERLRSALLAAVSLDVGPPVTSLKAGVADLLAGFTPADESAAEALAGIVAEADRLERVIGNLLDLGRLEDGSVKADVKVVAVEDLLESTTELLGRASRRVDTELDPRLPPVLGDFDLLRRALVNALDRALAVDPAGRVTVAAGRAGERVDISIVDHGPEVTADERLRLLAPLLGGQPSDDRGAGIGLAVARGLVEVAGGRLTLDETPGGGLTLVVSLPLGGRPVSRDAVAAAGS